MSQFPNEIYTPRTVENRAGVSYDASKTKVQFAEDTNKPNAEIVAIETALGTNPAGAYESVKAWLSALASAIGAIVVPTKATGAEINTGTDDTKFVTPKAIADSNVAFLSDVSAVLQTVYPVGSIYMATVSTNPATLFGFGTWSAYGEGRVPVGKASSGTFATAGAIGGEETHLLTSSESGLRAHSHTITGWFHTQPSAPVYHHVDNAGSHNFTGQASDIPANTAQNASSAHNNLQPYIVTYMWQRTA